MREVDLKKYTLEELLLAAMKSEIESHTVYTTIADQVKNGLLKDKLKFLAKEEEKHRRLHRTGVQSKVPKEKNHHSENDACTTPSARHP